MSILKRNFKRISIVFLAGFFVFGCIFNAGTTYSWFAFSSQESLEVLSGKVSYLPDTGVPGDPTDYGSFIAPVNANGETTYIYPGKELVKSSLRLKNKSTIESNVRVRITAFLSKGAGNAGESYFVYLGENTERGVSLLGMFSDVTSGSLPIPFMEIKFYQNPTENGGYSWVKAEKAVGTNCTEWELVPTGKNIAQARVRIPIGGEGEMYTTITSAVIVSKLGTEEKENLFTEMYSGKKMGMKVEYLARQSDGMEWSVFHTDVFHE